MESKQIEESVQKLAGTYLKDIVSILLCTVNSVDSANRQCDCTPIGGDATTDLPGVLLCAENNNGLVVFPTVGSTVIVALSTRNTAFVLMYSDIDSVQFMDGSLGGMVKVIDLVTKLNNLENLVNDLVSKFNSHVHILTLTSGTGTAAPTAAPEATVLTPTVRGDIENTLITQGA
jgi:hypothetical protein